jgi:hypothetical protein
MEFLAGRVTAAVSVLAVVTALLFGRNQSRARSLNSIARRQARSPPLGLHEMFTNISRVFTK